MWYNGLAVENIDKNQIENRKKKTMKKFLLLVKSLLDGTAFKQAIDNNYVSLGGQGRDRYGK